MSAFIWTTKPGGDSILLNVDRVERIEPAQAGSYVVFGSDDAVVVEADYKSLVNKFGADWVPSRRAIEAEDAEIAEAIEADDAAEYDARLGDGDRS